MLDDVFIQLSKLSSGPAVTLLSPVAALTKRPRAIGYGVEPDVRRLWMLVTVGAISAIRAAMFAKGGSASTAVRAANPTLQVFALTKQPICCVEDRSQQNVPAGSVGELPFRFVT
jgi:hypothetical protein